MPETVACCFFVTISVGLLICSGFFDAAFFSHRVHNGLVWCISVSLKIINQYSCQNVQDMPLLRGLPFFKAFKGSENCGYSVLVIF
jgi:hypothetical protein